MQEIHLLNEYASVISPDTLELDSDFSLYCDDTVILKKEKSFKALWVVPK
ncbi:MAG: hypothetical protein U9N33_01680 [Campylobacterota bacterium]|nr:hypothetical protein [Campylobacterota bacterium]